MLSLFAQHATAASITLYFGDPVSNEVDLLAGQTSFPVKIGVFNDTPPSDPVDFLTGWQVSLAILPEPGSTGAVAFASPLGPTAEDPQDYVLDNVSSGIVVQNDGDTLFAFDFNFPATGGREVPGDPGAALLVVELIATDGALGDFGVYAIAGLGGSEWTDANPLIQQSRNFTNVLPGLGPVLIGSVSVRVPEPASISLQAVLLVAAMSVRRGRKGRLKDAHVDWL